MGVCWCNGSGAGRREFPIQQLNTDCLQMVNLLGRKGVSTHFYPIGMTGQVQIIQIVDNLNSVNLIILIKKNDIEKMKTCNFGEHGF